MNAVARTPQKPYAELTDDFVRDAIRRICKTSKGFEEARDRINEELGCPPDARFLVNCFIESGGPETTYNFRAWGIGPSGKKIFVYVTAGHPALS